MEKIKAIVEALNTDIFETEREDMDSISGVALYKIEGLVTALHVHLYSMDEGNEAIKWKQEYEAQESLNKSLSSIIHSFLEDVEVLENKVKTLEAEKAELVSDKFQLVAMLNDNLDDDDEDKSQYNGPCDCSECTCGVPSGKYSWDGEN